LGQGGVNSQFKGQSIGLLGGSFDPPHAGHVHITKAALTRFGLDRVWWLVSPHNPLKANGPAPLPRRMAAAAAIMQHPRVTISDFEARAGTRFTADTIRALRSAYPGARFVWLMGADNLHQLDKWQDWEWIVHNVPIGVLARPGHRMAARRSLAARKYARFRLHGRSALGLGQSRAPAWAMINLPMSNLSSTQIRKSRGRV
jgi:nicotinate-nucleotide adenylyltransferase